MAAAMGVSPQMPLPYSQFFLYSVPQFTPNLPVDLAHRDPEQTHGVSAAAPMAHHYPAHSPQHTGRTAVFPPPAPSVSSSLKSRNRAADPGSRAGQLQLHQLPL